MCSLYPPEKINRILQCLLGESGNKKMKGLAATRRIILFLSLGNVIYNHPKTENQTLF